MIYYINCDAPMKIRCKLCGTISVRTLYNIKRGSSCDLCGYLSRKDKLKLDYETVKNCVQSSGHTLLSETYENVLDPLNLKCTSGHKFTRSITVLRVSHSCPECKTGTGTSEKICRKYFEYLFDKPFNKIHPPWLASLELDGFNEELNIAFEYQGDATL